MGTSIAAKPEMDRNLVVSKPDASTPKQLLQSSLENRPEQKAPDSLVNRDVVRNKYLERTESHFLQSTQAVFNARPKGVAKLEFNGTVFQKYKASKRCELFGKKGPRAKDVRQGDLGDCFLLANLASLAHHHPNKIRQMIYDNQDGTYSVRFYRRRSGGNFKPEWITVDGKLPRVFDLNPLNLGWRKEIYAQAKDSDLDRKEEIWVALIEKAFAIFDDKYGISDSPNEFLEGYDGIDGGRPDTALEALVGHRSKAVRLFHFNDAELWRLLKHADKGACITAGSRGMSDDEFAADGIPANHLYSVLGTEEDDGQRYVLLRNPWGHTEPNKLKGDGVFKIDLDEFRESFQHVCYAAK